MSRARGAGVYAGGLVFQQVVAFGVGIAAARWLGPHGLGQVGLVRALYGVAAILAPLGLDLSLLRRLGESPDSLERKLGELRTLRRIVFFVNLAAVALGATLLAPWLRAHVYREPGFGLDLDVALLGLPFAADLAVLTAACRALDRVAVASVATLYLQPLWRTLALGALLSLGLGPLGVLAATVIGLAVSDLTLSLSLARLARPDRGVRAREAARLFGVSGWMAAMLLTYGALKLLDVLVLGRARPAAEVGDYVALSTIAQCVGLYPTALSQTLGPRVARLHATGDRAGVRAELAAYVRRASRLSAPLFAGVAVFGPWLDLLFGRRFHFAPELSLPLALGAFVSGVFGPMAVSLSMTGRHRLEFAILLTGAAASLLAALALAPRLGGVGVAWAMCGGYVAVNAVRTAVSARVMGGLDLGVRDLAAPAACLVLALAVRRGAELLGRHDWPTALTAGALTLAAYAGLYAAGLLTREERAELTAALNRRRWRSAAGAAPCRS